MTVSELSESHNFQRLVAERSVPHVFFYTISIIFEVVLSTPVQSVQLYNSRGGCKRHAAFSGLLGPKDTVVINMQRMALPVVLTAEGTTYDRTRAFIKVCSAQSLLAQA